MSRRSSPSVPWFAEWLLARSLPPEVRESTLGDMAEAFRAMAPTDPTAARAWYWSQVLRSMNPRLRRPMRFASPSRARRDHEFPAGGGIMQSSIRDVRYGIRTTLKNPGFTAVVVLTLGLGIGANTAIFSVVDGILLRPLPFPESDRLVTVWADYTERDGPLREWLSFPNFHDLRQETDVFEGLAVWSSFNPTLTGAGEAAVVAGGVVSEGMFSRVLRIPPMLGRSFLPEDDVPGAPNVAMISHGFWTRQFGGEPNVPGRDISLNDVPYTIVGVMPPGFRPPFVPNADLWTTFQIDLAAASRGSANFRAFGRMRDGVQLETARARATALGTRLENEFPDDNTGVNYALFALQEDLTRSTRAPLLVLLGAVGFVMLIACVNVANLLLARMSARESELAVRAALGAGGGRLVRQLLTENAILAAAGGTVGIGLAVLGTRFLVSIAPSGTPRIEDVTVDLRILAFAAGVALLSTFLFGLLPALRGGRADLHDALKVGGRGMGAANKAHTMGNALVVSQVALALVLLVGSGLMIRSLRQLNAVDLGFEPEGMLSITLNLPQSRYPDRAARIIFYRDLETRLAALPGVQSAGSTNTVPLTGNNGDVNFTIEGRPLPRVGEEPALWLRRITPTYLETIGTRVLQGRNFTPSDDGEAPRVVIINETFARQFFPDENPVGKRINVNSRENLTWREIVGVAEDIKNFGIQQDSRYVAYFPFAQVPTGFMAMVLRTSGDPNALIPSARRVIAEMDPNLAASNLTTLDALVQASLGPERFVTLLLSLFAVVALTLASIGLYGVVSYGVSRRVREMGIRVALGAGDRDIRKLIVGRCVIVAAIGVGVGIGGGLLLTRTMESLLYGVPATDPLTFGLTAAVLLGVAAVAAAIPAHRAAKVDPMAVLNRE